MNRHRIVVPVVLAIGLLCLSAPVGATPIMVLNSSFEGPDTDTYLVGTIDDWTLSGTSAGVFDPAGCAGVCSSPGPYFVSGNTVPDGMQTAFSNGPEIHQVLGDVLTAGTTYTLEAYVGDRYDNLLPSHEIQLWAGANLVATNSGAPGDGEFVNVVATYTATGASPGLAEPLSIWLVNQGETQINWDDVRLDARAVPEPSTLLLFGTGMVLVGRRYRHRLKR